MIQLHYYPGNASLAPHMLLEELGVPFRLEYVDRTVAAHKSAGYLKMNPNGLIPVMVDGGLVLYETAAILLHLADTHPQSNLAPPAGTEERAQLYKWLFWMSNTLQATLIVYFYPERWFDEGSDKGAAEVKAHAEKKVGAMLDQMDAHLASHGQKWFLGERFSVLDPLGFLLCRWTRGFGRPARSLPQLGPYLQRMLERPAVRRAFETEKLGAPFV